MTRTQWVILAMLGFAIVVVFCFTFWVITLNMFPRNTETTSPQPVAAQTVTVFIVATPTPIILKITIDDIEKCCAGMTTIQENQYLASLVGSHVNWRGTVDETMLNGTVWVRVSSTRIAMRGVPPEIAWQLSKGQSINFCAVITKAEDAWLMPGVQLQFESLR